jgi:hypothetical protein
VQVEGVGHREGGEGSEGAEGEAAGKVLARRVWEIEGRGAREVGGVGVAAGVRDRWVVGRAHVRCLAVPEEGIEGDARSGNQRLWGRGAGRWEGGGKRRTKYGAMEG